MKVGKVFMVLMILVAFAGSALAAEDVLRIGVYEPLTGQNAFGGQLTVDGIKLAQEQKPEIIGKKVELFIVDNKSDKVEAANAVKRLIEKEKVIAIIGSYGSSLSMAGGEVAEKSGVPCLTDSATNPLVTQGKNYYFRMCFIDPYQGAAAAQYAFDNGAKKGALLLDVAQDYSVGLGKFFQQAFEGLGGEIVARLNYQTGDQDFTAQLTEINNQGAEVLFIPSYFAEGAIIIKQARELGGEFSIMGGDAMDNPDMIAIGGDAIEGFAYTTFPYAPEMPDMTKMAEEFTAQWKEAFPDKDPNANSALGYDCYMLIADAIERAYAADKDAFEADPSEAIAKALGETKGWEGVTGATTINATHDAEKPVGIKVVKDGKQVYTASVMPQL